MDQEEYLKWEQELENSNGHKKIMNYIREIFDSDYFQSFVVQVRKKYQIPENGFSIKSRGWLPYPKNWVGSKDDKMLKQFIEEMSEFAEKYHIHYEDCEDAFVYYIFYNEKNFYFCPASFNVCRVSDLKNEADEPFSKKTQAEDNRIYPIAIRISPYASLRDILDFTRRVYKHEIAPLQGQYKDKGIKLGKFKTKKTAIQERNNFIYENKDLPRKQIMRLVTDKFGEEHTVDYGYIGKIISLESRKRKEL
jgi:hypothetical protein